jgi:thiamine kinase-like enzyme
MDPKARAESLSCWRGKVSAEPLGGGITNTNFVVKDGGERFVVRIGDDIPVHGVMRFNELAAARAAHAANLSPEIVHSEPGAFVMRFIEGRTLAPEDVRRADMLPRVVELVSGCHRFVGENLRGPALMFWVFHVVRDYARTLLDGGSRHAPMLFNLMSIAQQLEEAVGPTRIAFCHNDLLAANILDDGKRLWLIDWDYAGFNSPLFDLANLATNNGFDADDEEWLRELYFGADSDPAIRRSFAAMRAASLLRETMWSMVSEIHSSIEFDYLAYTAENLARFEAALEAFKALR